ncbi:hypothetical protein F8S13_12095 [Chloroflexia bacterium SDU3-3]|nr:hypothetical protein F8S13_12095 [Chloroflexia bacterium SDU3-3]
MRLVPTAPSFIIRPLRAHRWMRAALAIAIGLAVGAALLLAAAWVYERTHASEHEVVFVIPRSDPYAPTVGSHTRTLPSVIELQMGQLDTVIIRNEDTQPVQFGPFKLEGGQVLHQRYQRAGSYDLECTASTHQELAQINVAPAAGDLWSMARAMMR